ncbi:chromosome partitioning protein [Streptomyces phaeofaciens]|uniref:chromosome partitioning protein n=1 Tax=Streptomyces phaeofaciens TaxID=68254 RepID=UPI001679D615|nr:chromosome partitioning protein [Streptomyces phaeofaciens]
MGYLFAWAVRKLGTAADRQVDQALDTGIDRLHTLVSDRLGADDPALQQAAEEARDGQDELAVDTRQWLALTINNAAKKDEEFAKALMVAVEAVQAAARAAGGASAGGDGIAIGGDAEIHAAGGSVAAVRIDGPVTVGIPANPQQPGAEKG